MQNLIVAAIVIACTAYAAWSLMPAAWRGGLLRRIGRAPQQSGGCGGCGGCGAVSPTSAASAAPASAVITVNKRPPVV